MNDREARARLLETIRRSDALASAEWRRGLDTTTGEQVLSVRETGSSQIQDIATLRPGISFDDEQILINGRAWIRALLALLDEAFDHIRAHKMQIQALERKAAGREPANYAAECAMTCASAEFRLWLIDKHGLDPNADAERVKTRTRSLLNISSRANLNTDPAAAARWQRMKKDFEQWKRR